MLTALRWQKERELMASVFSGFQPFAGPSLFGFEGRLRGPRSGTLYHVCLEALRETYPQCPPKIRMHPKVGHHWVDQRGGRALCVIRHWQASRSTFANTLLAVLRYLDEYDGVPARKWPSPFSVP